MALTKEPRFHYFVSSGEYLKVERRAMIWNLFHVNRRQFLAVLSESPERTITWEGDMKAVPSVIFSTLLEQVLKIRGYAGWRKESHLTSQFLPLTCIATFEA